LITKTKKIKTKITFVLNSLYAIARPSVCLSVCLPSVCHLLRLCNPIQAIKIFGNVSTPFNTLAICWHPGKILRRSSQGNPSVGGVKHKRGSQSNIAIMDLSNAISRKRCKTGGKLLLMTNRKSHMSFRLVPNSVTLEDLERRNSPNCRVILPNSVAFGTDYVKVVRDTLILFPAEM